MFRMWKGSRRKGSWKVKDRRKRTLFPPKPDLVRWAKRWPLKKEFLDVEDAELLFLAKNSHEAFTIIEKTYQSYMEEDKKFCLNYKKYKI